MVHKLLCIDEVYTISLLISALNTTSILSKTGVGWRTIFILVYWPKEGDPPPLHTDWQCGNCPGQDIFKTTFEVHKKHQKRSEPQVSQEYVTFYNSKKVCSRSRSLSSKNCSKQTFLFVVCGHWQLSVSLAKPHLMGGGGRRNNAASKFEFDVNLLDKYSVFLSKIDTLTWFSIFKKRFWLHIY